MANESQYQAARAGTTFPPVEQANPEGRSNRMLAGAGSLLAVLAFLGGMAVGHSWDGSSNQQNQFGGPGTGFRGGQQQPGQQQVPGQQQLPGQQQVPGQQQNG
jgi:hypothetical protein